MRYPLERIGPNLLMDASADAILKGKTCAYSALTAVDVLERQKLSKKIYALCAKSQ